VNGLVLSLFPGIDLLGMAFERAGFCVVRGPDVIWGGDIRSFHPPAGRFDGVIGGPPCQMFTVMKRLVKNAGEKHGNLIPEYERCVGLVKPRWFIMEEVPAAPTPKVDGYVVRSLLLNNRWLGEAQERTRRISFGTAEGLSLFPSIPVFESMEYVQAVTGGARAVPVKLGGSGKPKRTYMAEGKRKGPNEGPRARVSQMLVWQGFPPDMLDECPLTEMGKRQAVGNGVPLAMGTAIAEAVKRAIGAA